MSHHPLIDILLIIFGLLIAVLLYIIVNWVLIEFQQQKKFWPLCKLIFWNTLLIAQIVALFMYGNFLAECF